MALSLLPAAAGLILHVRATSVSFDRMNWSYETGAPFVIAMLLARYLFAERLRHAIERKPKLVAIMDAVDAEGWRIVALCRLASPIPSMIQSALFGLTRIRVWPYAWATFVFTTPQIALYAYLGAVGRTALLGEGEGLSLGIMAAGGLTFLIVVLLITRRVRASMRAIEARRSA